MKLTPEQQAFFEYGKARKALEITKKQLAKELHWYSSRHQARDYNNIDILIRDVWRKRAACRIKCGQCVHFSADEWGPRRDGCLKRCCGVKSDRCAVGCRYWEPRKEGE